MDDDLLWRLINSADNLSLSRSDCAPLELFLRGEPQIAYDRILTVITERGRLSDDRKCRILDNNEHISMGYDANNWARRFCAKLEWRLNSIQLPAATIATAIGHSPIAVAATLPANGWTRDDVEAAVRLEIEKFRDTIQDARKGNRSALKAVQKTFGRNKTAKRIAALRKTSIIPYTQVSGSVAWIGIADELDIRRGAHGPGRKKIGMVVALKEEAEATGDTTQKSVDTNDAIKAVEQSEHLEADTKKDWIIGLRDGRLTTEQVFEFLEAYANIVTSEN